MASVFFALSNEERGVGGVVDFPQARGGYRGGLAVLFLFLLLTFYFFLLFSGSFLSFLGLFSLLNISLIVSTGECNAGTRSAAGVAAG